MTVLTANHDQQRQHGVLTSNIPAYTASVLFFLSTHADKPYISVTVCLCVCVCLFVRFSISPARIKLAASNFARRFIGVQGREWHSLVNCVGALPLNPAGSYPDCRYRLMLCARLSPSLCTSLEKFPWRPCMSSPRTTMYQVQCGVVEVCAWLIAV